MAVAILAALEAPAAPNDTAMVASIVSAVMPMLNLLAVSSLMPQALPSSVKPAARLYLPSEASDVIESTEPRTPTTPAAIMRGLAVMAPMTVVAIEATAPTMTPMILKALRNLFQKLFLLFSLICF